MASIHAPVHIEYYLEDYVSDVVEATPVHVLYKAYDRCEAAIATAMLLAHGHSASHYSVSHHNHTTWLIHSST